MATAARQSSRLKTPRDARAPTGYITVLPDSGDVFTGVFEKPAYADDAREGRCTCPDHHTGRPGVSTSGAWRSRLVTGWCRHTPTGVPLRWSPARR